MSKKLRRRRGAVVTLCAAIVPVAAGAQETPIDRIEAIERQIRNLQGELQSLKKELGEAKQQLQQSRRGARNFGHDRWTSSVDRLSRRLQRAFLLGVDHRDAGRV